MKTGLPEILQVRSAAACAIRGFFLERNYLEVDTPVCIATPALEQYLVALEADGQYLRTSPELHMKRLLAAGAEAIYQLGPCFRAGEYGRLHRSEFGMLEWYRTGADYRDILHEMQALLPAVAHAVCNVTGRNPAVDLEMGWEVETVSAVYRRWAGWDPVVSFDADRFDQDMVNVIEPEMPRDRCLVLMDYPAEVAALARLKREDPRIAERWELYAGGLELANAFSELTDAAEQRARFQACAAAKAATGEPVYALDEAFLGALAAGLPPCAGVALGFDRLLMAVMGLQDIQDVRAFKEQKG